MPLIRSLVSKCYVYIITSIILLSRLMPFISYYIKKGLVCIIIINFFTSQPSSYSKYIKLNMYLFYSIQSVSNTKYTFYTYLTSF